MVKTVIEYKKLCSVRSYSAYLGSYAISNCSSFELLIILNNLKQHLYNLLVSSNNWDFSFTKIAEHIEKHESLLRKNRRVNEPVTMSFLDERSKLSIES